MDSLNNRWAINDYIENSLKKCFLGNIKLVKCTSSEVFVTDYIVYNGESINNDVESNLIESIKKIDDKYYITLKRNEVFRVLFSKSADEEHELEVQQKRNCSVIVNSSLHISQHFDLKALRHLVIKNFIVKLLEYNGFDVFTTKSFPNNDDLKNLKNSFSGCGTNNDPKINASNSETICDNADNVMDVLKRNQFSEVLDDGCLKINLKDYIDKMSNMSHRYSSNVTSLTIPPLFSKSLCQVQLLSNKLKEIPRSITNSCEGVQKCKNEKIFPCRVTLQCIHIVDTDHYLQQQMDDVLWTMVDETCKHIHQVHLLHGSVCSGMGTSIEESLKEQHVEYQNRSSTLSPETQLDLALDILKFDLLDVRCTREINAYPGSSFSNKSSSMFVFYNYARISTVLDKFRQHVLQFDCTDVPAPDQIDVSLFKVDIEWTLLFQYIVEYPSVLRRCIVTEDADDNRVMSVQTHKLCQFLCSLSACFSKYYSKAKILLVNEKHQWPVMHARISLVTIIRNIYLHAFNLLDITPFNRL